MDLKKDIFGKEEQTADPDAATEFYPDEKDKREDIDLKKFKQLWTNNPEIVNHIKKDAPDGGKYVWAPSSDSGKDFAFSEFNLVGGAINLFTNAFKS